MPNYFTYGRTLQYPRGLQLLLDAKLERLTWGYKGTGWHWPSDQRFRLLTPQWFPLGTVLEVNGAVDLDCWMVNKQQTMLRCGFTQEWLDDNEPGNGLDGQIPLF